MRFWTRFWIGCAVFSVLWLAYVVTDFATDGWTLQRHARPSGSVTDQKAGQGAPASSSRRAEADAAGIVTRTGRGGVARQLPAMAPQVDAALNDLNPGNAESLSAEAPSKVRGNSREPDVFAQLRSSKDRPVSPEVRALAEEITRDATNGVGKARAIYDWIASNIIYDTEEWENIVRGADGYIHDHSPEAVLERGSAVCIGYAWLFDDLCEAAGIEATWLVGDVRGYRGTIDDELVSDVRHAWNAVKLDDGEWHLLDLTWGARQDGEDAGSKSAKERADYYFDTPPGQFVYDHLPEDESWQLLGEPIPSDVAFALLPNLKPTFFTNGLLLDRDLTGILKAPAGKAAALPFSVPKGTLTAATIGTSSGEFRRLTVARTGGGGRAAVLPELSPGEYILRLYSGSGESRMLECSADFLIRIE